jgi:molybdopterin/thiamine biosynthesis adenylyltransferase
MKNVEDITRDGPAEALLDSRFSREAAAGYRREIIEDSNILVVGAGALGQFLMLCLALIGYPRVTCVDMDDFEESNATRSPFYSDGWPKAKAVTLGARQLCTAGVGILYRYAECMIQRLGDAIYQGPGRTAVLSAVDSPDARFWLAQRCRRASILLVEGGFRAERWNASVFPNTGNDDPCWACGQGAPTRTRIFSCDAYARKAEKRGFIPATASGAMALAGTMVALMTKMLHGDSAMANCTLSADLTRGVVHRMRRAFDFACAADHRCLPEKSVRVSCGPTDSIATLLTQVTGLVADPMVELPATFIGVAPCAKCRKSVLVMLPEWAVTKVPTCKDCGGTFSRFSGVPEQHGLLSWQTSETLYEARLEDIGIGPGLHLDVQGAKDRLTVVVTGDVSPHLTVAQLEPRS